MTNRSTTIISLEMTIKEKVFDKYDIIRVGDQRLLCIEHPKECNEGYKVPVLLMSNNELQYEASLLDTILPEYEDIEDSAGHSSRWARLKNRSLLLGL